MLPISLTPKPTEHYRLSDDLFYVLSKDGLNNAISIFHGGRNFGDSKSYKVIHRAETVYPAVVAMDLEVDRNFKTEIIVWPNHLPELKEQLTGGGLTPAEKLVLVERHLQDKLH
jgi:hypothetical protein